MGMAREHFVLVHGEGHGGWCWFKLRWLLEGSGYRVTCIDLAGAGVDPTDPKTVRSFEQYDRPLLDLISALPDGKKESILASMLMRPWPVTAIGTASFEGDDERLNRIKRVYIKTERDHMLDPQQQESMIKKWPPSEVLVIDTDHSPFFSAPEQLFNLIVKSL